MIVKLYEYFGIVGIASILAWLGALAMVVNYALHARRTFFYARAMALALAGLVLAQVNSFYVSRIEVDRRQDIKEARERQRRAQRGGGDMLDSKMAGMRFAEDAQDDFLDMAGVASSDKRSVYEQAADENQPAAAKKARKARWTEQSRKVRMLSERDLARANRLDVLNLWMARFIPILIFLLLALDYFLRFNRTLGTFLPLPFAGRIVDSLFPKKHSVVFRAGNPGLIPARLDAIIRKGETFIYFSEAPRVIKKPVMFRLVIPLRDFYRSAVEIFRPTALLKLHDRVNNVSGQGRLPWIGKIRSRIMVLLRAVLALVVRAVKTLWRWITAPLRWILLRCRRLVQKVAAFPWVRKAAGFIRRLLRGAILFLGRCLQGPVEYVRRLGKDIRGGTVQFWPAKIMDATPEKEFNPDFIFECAWFNRYGFTVEGLERSTALVEGLRKFIGERMVPRASAAKTVHLVWNFPGRVNAELLRPVAVFSREVNLKLVVFASDDQVAEVGKWVEEVCPDEVPPLARPSLLEFVLVRVRRVTSRFRAWWTKRREQTKAKRELVRAERAAKAAAKKAAMETAAREAAAKVTAAKEAAARESEAREKAAKAAAEAAAAAKEKAALEAQARSALKVPKVPVATVASVPIPKHVKPVAAIKKPVVEVVAPAPVADIKAPVLPNAPPVVQVQKPEVAIKPLQPVIPSPVAKPVVAIKKPVVEVAAPAPVADVKAPVPPKAPPAPPPMPELKMPQPAPVPPVMPKIKAVQPSVVAPPKPMPKVEFLQPVVISSEKQEIVIPGPKIKVKVPPPAAESKPAEPAPRNLPGNAGGAAPRNSPGDEGGKSPIAEVNRASGEFKFYCSACQQKLAAKIDWQGKSIICPVCRKKITIPTI